MTIASHFPRAIVASLFLSAAATAALAQETTAVAPVKAEGYRTGVDGTFAPHAFPKLDGTVQGFNIDLMAAISEKLGVPVEVTAAQFSGLIPAMQAGTYDFIGAPTTVTEERAGAMLFTEGFMDTDFGVATLPGSPLKDLDGLRGKTIAVNKGSAYEAWLTQRAAEYGWTVVTFGTQADAFEAVTSGRADASLSGMTVAAWGAKQNPKLSLAFEIKTGLVWSLPFRKDDYATRNLFDEVLECLKTDGTMAKLSEKWFGITPEAGQTIVTPTPGFGVPGFAGYQDVAHEVTCDFRK